LLAQALAVSLLAASGARADSVSVWLPAAREELESAERLDEPPDDARDRGAVLARVGRSASGAWEARRFTASWRTGTTNAGPATRELSASVLGADGRLRPTLTLAAGAARLAAGRLAGERAPWLLARRLGLARSYARVPEARAAPLRAAAPVGASAEAADGVAAEWEGRRLHPWALAGRGAPDGSPLAAAGLTARARRGDGAVAAGWSAARPFLSLAAEWRGEWAVTSVEALLARGGPAVLATVTSRRSGMEWWCRYRYQPGEARPAAGETGVAARGRRGGARLTWRAWTPASRTDNGALELEGTAALGAGRVLRARVGERAGTAQTGAASWAAGGMSHERYALLDVTLARAGSRSLAFLASARRGPGPGRTGRLLGARLRAGAEGSSRLTLLVQASRTDAGAAALGAELTASGQSTLAERSRSGVALAARGVARRGPLELGGVWEREEGAGGARPRSASVWVRWFL
jgi:hypothetical protein